MNLRPSGYEPDELPDCSIPRRFMFGLSPFGLFEAVVFGLVPFWGLGRVLCPNVVYWIGAIVLERYVSRILPGLAVTYSPTS